MMKLIAKTIAVIVIGSGLVVTGLVVHAETKKAAAIAAASVTMENAVEIALQTVPGDVIGAEFELEHGQAVWEVEILAASQQFYELEIDATSGQLLRQELEEWEDDD